jgi:hypothetical protein
MRVHLEPRAQSGAGGDRDAMQSNPGGIAYDEIESTGIEHVGGVHAPGEREGATVAEAVQFGAQHADAAAKRCKAVMVVRQGRSAVTKQVPAAQQADQLPAVRAGGSAFRIDPGQRPRSLGALERSGCGALTGA